MIVGFTITGGPISFLTTVTGAAIGYGISHLITEGDRQNDNKIGWGIAKIFGATPENSPAANSSTCYLLSNFVLFIECMITPVLAQNALTEVEVVYYLTSVVGGIEVSYPCLLLYLPYF